MNRCIRVKAGSFFGWVFVSFCMVLYIGVSQASSGTKDAGMAVFHGIPYRIIPWNKADETIISHAQDIALSPMRKALEAVLHQEIPVLPAEVSGFFVVHPVNEYA